MSETRHVPALVMRFHDPDRLGAEKQTGPVDWPLGLDGGMVVIAVLTAYYEPRDLASLDLLRPTSVTIDTLDGLTTGDLQRFRWARWLRVADAYVRFGPASRQMATAAGIKTVARRPGRGGHDARRWAEVEARFKALMADPTVKAPARVIADEFNVSESTARNWKARFGLGKTNDTTRRKGE